MNKICPTCGSKIINGYRATKYCSIKCRNSSNRSIYDTEKIICLHCKKPFYVPNWRSKVAKFCSNRCKGLANLRQYNEERTGTCAQCGERFIYKCNKNVIKKYCSRPCQRKAGYYSGSITIICQQCGKKFDVYKGNNKARFCSHTCHNIAQREIFRVKKLNGIRRAFVRRGWITKCQRCGYDKHPEILGIHHKDRDRRNNRLDNLEVLCPNCHSLEHRKHLINCTPK